MGGRPHVSAEIQNVRKERADMHRHVKRQPLVRPAGLRREGDQMRRRTDRQNVGNALNDGEHDELEERNFVRARQAVIPFPNRTTM